MRQITKDINTLKENDLISIILYSIYLFTKDPEYATIAELAYTLDKDSMNKLCATFGGTTIKVPTLKQYKQMIKVMLVFDYVNREKLSLTEACEKAEIEDVDLEEVIKMYSMMSKVVDLYND